MNNNELSDALRHAIRRVRDGIAENGWDMVTTAVSGQSMPYAYSVGFHSTWQHPEIIIFGKPGAIARAALTEVADRLRSGCWRASEGLADDFFGREAGWVLQARPDAVRQYMQIAHAIAGSRCAAMQVVAPDRNGLFPWDRGYRGINAPILAVMH